MATPRLDVPPYGRPVQALRVRRNLLTSLVTVIFDAKLELVNDGQQSLSIGCDAFDDVFPRQ